MSPRRGSCVSQGNPRKSSSGNAFIAAESSAPHGFDDASPFLSVELAACMSRSKSQAARTYVWKRGCAGVASRGTRSFTAPVSTTEPSSTKAQSSQSAQISCRICVTTRHAMPCVLTAYLMSRIVRGRTSASRQFRASSRSKTSMRGTKRRFGANAGARALNTYTRCRWPPESSPQVNVFSWMTCAASAYRGARSSGVFFA
mmetsp:Transcript_7325/g.22561  ORF Transcript_7325/g.22561 Transcript_7325/m.22561 type:complete len:201 (+) Transcript_7325:519-1121(+)